MEDKVKATFSPAGFKNAIYDVLAKAQGEGKGKSDDKAKHQALLPIVVQAPPGLPVDDALSTAKDLIILGLRRAYDQITQAAFEQVRPLIPALS